MKIISKFKDYYDPVAMTWGGGDPKIRYERLEIKNTGPFEFREIVEPISIYGELHSKYNQRLLIVGERVYSVFCAAPSMSNLYAPTQYFVPEETHEIMMEKVPAWEARENKIYYNSKDAIELCKLVGQPVFWIRQFYKTPGLSKLAFKQRHLIEVSKEPPKLCEIENFAKLYPADQIYQDLSYVLGNLMHNPPDDNPPVQVEEKVRWAKKGFDAKTSFRGK